ncbi:MAG: two-component sensor histidine kinase [Chitinophagaceae bacterium]|nr:MAG: two-component sensor histidine kinase [Chitinophagaceae bacterium]
MAYARLSNIFLARQEIDSAYFYLRKQNAVRDSLTAVKDDNLVQYQLTAIREQKKLQQLEKDEMERRNLTRMIALGIGLLVLLLIGLILYRNNRQKHKANIVLADTLANLKNTQAQLLHSEKMASLGELTAGIAHEIQNPLNFVTNFSELSNELIEEMNDALQEGDLTAARSIAADVQENLQKINHHGKRADGIVKGMLQHSKSSKGQKEPTDVNALCDEYLRLSYHGLRAKDKSFNATLKTDFDESIGKINLIPQDIGRVIMNLLTNAFYAVNEKAQHATRNTQPETFYEPTVSIRTKKLNDKIEIRVSDNGNGIPAHILDKIFQPFFTTKPTGQGTGLGLSLSYDIISKGHGGELKAESQEGNGSTFIIQLPLKYV